MADKPGIVCRSGWMARWTTLERLQVTRGMMTLRIFVLPYLQQTEISSSSPGEVRGCLFQLMQGKIGKSPKARLTCIQTFAESILILLIALAGQFIPPLTE